VRTLAGRREGVALFTFCLGCAIGCAWLGYSFHEAARVSAAKKEHDRRWVANSIEGVEQMQASLKTPGSARVTPIKPTGDPENDAISQLMNFIMGDLVETMNGIARERDALGMQGVFAVELVANEGEMTLESWKREKWRDILAKHRGLLAGLEDRCADQIAKLDLSEKDKLGVARGVHSALEALAPKYGHHFDLLVNQAQSEQDLLEFLVANFANYKIKEKTIAFTNKENAARYQTLAKDCRDTTSALAAVVEADLAETEAKKAALKELVH